MADRQTYYTILGVSAVAPEAEVKAAYRRLALKLHPDTNRDDPQSSVRFLLVQNAYGVLSDSSKRAAYDGHLRKRSGTTSQSTSRLRIPGVAESLEVTLEHTNYILWEIEDLVVRNPAVDEIVDGRPLHVFLLRVLVFLDKWVISPAGHPDYFFSARQRSAPANRVPAFSSGGTGHQPYVNVTDYFYNVRVRFDRFLNRLELVDLLAPVPDTPVHLVDAILESQRYAAHYVSHVQSVLAGKAKTVPEFVHTQTFFDIHQPGR